MAHSHTQLEERGVAAWAVDILGWGFTDRSPQAISDFSPKAKREHLRGWVGVTSCVCVCVCVCVGLSLSFEVAVSPFMCVCVCVCMYVCMYVCVWGGRYIYTFVCVFVYIL
jgi:hypothetical protein